MSFQISGTYVASCSCSQICPCPVDGMPTGPNGACYGAAVFHVAKGHLDNEDLSGLNFALYNYFPSNISAGKWKMGIVVDEKATEEQAKSLERILAGQEGGPFAEFVPLIAELVQTERATVTFTSGKKPSGTIGPTTLMFEPHLGADGTPVTVKGAPFAFAPEFAIGTSPGNVKGPFGTFQSVYGESADYEYSDKPMAGAAKGRV